MRIILVALRLIQHTEHLVKPVVDNTMEQRDLDDDTVMHKTLYKGVRHAFGHLTSFIVVSLVTYIQHRHVNVADPVTHYIDGHHRIGETLMAALLSVDIVLVTVLGAKILTEAKGLRLYPRLLKFYKDEFRLVLTRSDTGTEVDTEHRDLVVGLVGILVRTKLNTDDFLLQQCRQHCPGHTLVLHEIFEHGVVNRIGYVYHT